MLPYRTEVTRQLSESLAGVNLHTLAKRFGVTVYKKGNLNKGWVGQTLERAAGLNLSNRQLPDGMDFELKSTSLICRDEVWMPKETIKITQLNLAQILEEKFQESSLWKKLQRLVLIGVSHQSPTECHVVRIGAVDLNDEETISEIRAFWEDIRELIYLDDLQTLLHLGKSEDLIQLRPTGDGKLWSESPVSRRKIPAQAFYATKRLLLKLFQSTFLL